MKYQQFINGTFKDGCSKEHFSVISPIDGREITKYPFAAESDVNEAINSAHDALYQWKNMSALKRADYLLDIAAFLKGNTDEIARQITTELGKPLVESQAEVATAIGMFRWAAEEARRIYGRSIPARSPGVQQFVQLEPRGVVAAISGWNAPAITPSRKISSALAAGCTIVIKPSEETAGVALCIAQAAQKAKLPAGVLNMVFGPPAQVADIFCNSPLVSMITFTGGTEVGKGLAVKASQHLKHATLELGGHAPVIVWRDAPIEKVVAATARVKYRNSGQVCTSPTRFLIHEDIYDEFSKEFIKQAQAIKVGDPFAAGIQMGPLKNERRLQAVEKLVARSLEQGATLLTGGKRLDCPGFYYEPTVLAVDQTKVDACHIEPFGPVAVLMKVESLDQALQQANALPFGLASYVFTQNMKVAYRCTQEIDSGVVCVNELQASLPETPFGGFKDSGLGSEGGSEGIMEFLRVKSIRQGDLL